MQLKYLHPHHKNSMITLHSNRKSLNEISGNKINTCVADDDVFEQVGVCHLLCRSL